MSNEFISADAFFTGSLPRAAQDYPVSAQAEITQQTAAEGVVPLGGAGVGGVSTEASRIVTATAIALPPLPPGGGPGYAPSITTGRVLLALIGSPFLGQGELIFGGTDSPEARAIEVDDLPTIPVEKISGAWTGNSRSVSRDVTDADLVGNLLLLVHGLGTNVVDVSVRDASGNAVFVENHILSANAVSLSFEGLRPLANPYTVLVEA